MSQNYFFFFGPNAKKDAPQSLAAQVLGDPKAWLFLLAACLYLSGYVFNHHFLVGLGLPSNANDVPVYALFIYASNVLLSGSILGAGSLLVPLAVLMVRFYVPTWVSRRAGVVVLVWVLVFPLILLGAQNAASKARRDILTGEANLPLVSMLEPKGEAKTAWNEANSARWAQARSFGRLLLQNDEGYYLLYIEAGKTPGIFYVRREDVALLELQVIDSSAPPASNHTSP